MTGEQEQAFERRRDPSGDLRKLGSLKRAHAIPQGSLERACTTAQPRGDRSTSAMHHDVHPSRHPVGTRSYGLLDGTGGNEEAGLE
ncbi:hypothetical protein [Streptomyces sp. AP-93]|uniref:hypothetical protein n=1 Tax=Streptomyces sp. AP-93 TaxID=2929048 RepID=UPI001FB0467C|nr:hypothetical protein [Streptomyces sp. AP-93]MCJ0871887.1 hypothetical protein [Streptomyces sp. AP-93]